MTLAAMQSYTVPLSSSVGMKGAINNTGATVSLKFNVSLKVILAPPGGVAPISMNSTSGTAMTTQIASVSFPLDRKTTGEFSTPSIRRVTMGTTARGGNNVVGVVNVCVYVCGGCG